MESCILTTIIDFSSSYDVFNAITWFQLIVHTSLIHWRPRRIAGGDTVHCLGMKMRGRINCQESIVIVLITQPKNHKVFILNINDNNKLSQEKLFRIYFFNINQHLRLKFWKLIAVGYSTAKWDILAHVSK